MAQLSIVFWRDIPAQVVVKEGRKTARRILPERFEQAIDRCAMKVGARDSDAYLAEWRRSDPVHVDGDVEAAAQDAAARLVSEYDGNTVKKLIEQGGWSSPA
ncbi:MAG: virulence factor [Pseudomonadota bacterium]